MRPAHAPLPFFTLLVALVGCDAALDSNRDASSTAPPDAGGFDAAFDAEPPADAARELDAGPMLDAAATLDAGAMLDAGARDAASVRDAGAPPGDGGFTGTPCRAGGVDGTCLDVTQCTGTSTPGLCPGPSAIRCCTATPPMQCDVSTMPQPNAGLLEEPGAGGCPAGMLRVTATLCIDRFEAAISVVGTDGSLTPWSPFFNPGTRRIRALSLRGAVPQGYISGTQAARACTEAGKRLCTDAEWQRACRGPSNTTYPYGNTRQPGVCNDARAVHPAVERFGTSASWIYSRLGDPCISQLAMSLDRTGDNPGCVTAEGALDMMGNLHEWTADPNGTFRGGFYVDTVLNGPGCLYATTAHDTGHWDYSTGFRCCAD